MKIVSRPKDNHPAAKQAKIDLRLQMLAAVQPANVLDCFCGTGEMYRGAWHRAARYAGCDERPWDRSHPPRFVADNRRLMRAIDLQCYNVFDFDSYGSPWDQFEILAARRRWAPGEQGAVVFTDGSSLKLRWGSMPASLARFLGVPSSGGVPSTAGESDFRMIALTNWALSSGVKISRMWQARGVGQARVVYGAVIFAGAPAR